MTDILVTKWSNDHVCAWVGTQNFRAYKHVFREGLISGRTLLALDHAILEVREVNLRAAIFSPASDPRRNSNSLSTNSCRIMLAKCCLFRNCGSLSTRTVRTTLPPSDQHLRRTLGLIIHTGMEILFAIEDLKAIISSSGSSPQVSLATRSNQYDVFLSYRRVGGAGRTSFISTKLCSF